MKKNLRVLVLHFFHVKEAVFSVFLDENHYFERRNLKSTAIRAALLVSKGKRGGHGTSEAYTAPKMHWKFQPVLGAF